MKVRTSPSVLPEEMGVMVVWGDRHALELWSIEPADMLCIQHTNQMKDSSEVLTYFAVRVRWCLQIVSCCYALFPISLLRFQE